MLEELHRNGRIIVTSLFGVGGLARGLRVPALNPFREHNEKRARGGGSQLEAVYNFIYRQVARRGRREIGTAVSTSELTLHARVRQRVPTSWSHIVFAT